MNKRQRRILKIAAVLVALMLLYPPFYYDLGFAYAWLWDEPVGGRVDVALLFAQWAAVGIVAAILYKLARD